MIQVRASIANWLWKKLCQPAQRRMTHAVKAPQQAQHAVLSRILQQHASCAYGSNYGLKGGMDYATFKKILPVITYDELAPWIERMKLGEREVLCNGEILAFEKSSGSTASAKWIPFNQGLRNEFQEAVRAWMGDLHQRNPSLTGGRAYWVVSPLQHAEQKTAGGTVVGMANDDEYLGWWERKLSYWLRVANNPDLEITTKELIAAKDLRLISIWNPSYLALLWDKITSLHDSDITPIELWPKLEIISGWADASAAADAEKIKQLFPDVTFQPKGLLATEGVVTIPWGHDSTCGVPALNSHFLEFQDCQTREIYRVHELQQGSDYEPILTTSGGLWRYHLGDVVRVEGYAEKTPRLRFLGRTDGGSDLRGEKLNPLFVQQQLAKLTNHFAMLAPNTNGETPYYVLFTTDRTLDKKLLDDALSENPYYAHAVAVGQLGSVRIFEIEDASPSQIYLQRCASLAQRCSTVKATALHRMGDWEKWFQGTWRE
jgi:GH3 auxin-responsive promoter